MQPIGFVYLTTNLITGKKYIGQHTNFEDKYFGSGKIIKMALKKHGEENFKREVLSYAYTQEELNQLEKEYIAYYNAIESKEFYNIHVGGCGGDTYNGHTQEEKMKFKERMRVVTKGKNNGMYGKKHKGSTITLLKAKRTQNNEKYQTAEFKETMSNATHGENNGMFGKNHSSDSKQLMSENRKGITAGAKNPMFGKTGENAINGKKVFQYQDESHEILIGSFNSVQCVLKYLKIKGHSALDKAIKNNTIYRNYYWSKEK